MNKTVSYILIGGGSALAGAVVGYLLCKKRVQDIFQDEVAKEVNKELDKIRELRAQKEKPVEDGQPSPNDDVRDICIDLIHEEFGEDLNETRVETLAAAMERWHEEGLSEEECKAMLDQLIAEHEEATEEEELITEEELPQYQMEPYLNKPPEVIPLHEYEDLPTTFEFVTFHYYEEDDVLLDDGDMVVDDIERTVGDALVHFGECDEMDDDTVYVVNGNFGLAIEIVRLHAAYSEWNGWGEYAR